jgi:hypothetical protein
MVTTPVPPTPVIRKAKPSASNARVGSCGWSTYSICGRTREAGVMLRKDGQSPARQEKSRLQEDWLVLVLRPNSVVTGCTDVHGGRAGPPVDIDNLRVAAHRSLEMMHR